MHHSLAPYSHNASFIYSFHSHNTSFMNPLIIIPLIHYCHYSHNSSFIIATSESLHYHEMHHSLYLSFPHFDKTNCFVSDPPGDKGDSDSSSKMTNCFSINQAAFKSTQCAFWSKGTSYLESLKTADNLCQWNDGDDLIFIMIYAPCTAGWLLREGQWSPVQTYTPLTQ